MYRRSESLRAARPSSLVTTLTLILALIATVVPAAAERRMLPLFDLTTAATSIDLEVEEIQFPPGRSFAWDELASGPTPVRTLEGTVLAYLERSLAGRYDELSELLVEDANPTESRQIAQLMEVKLSADGAPESLRLLRLWSFGEYRVALVEMTSDTGATSVFSLSLRQVGDRFLRADDWGELQPVQMLFWYLARNFQKGWLPGPGIRPRNQRFEIAGAGGESIALHFDAEIYPDEGWLPPHTDLDPTTVLGFVHRVFGVAETGSENEFIDLWVANERPRMRAYQSKTPAHVSALQTSAAAQGPVRDLMTISLGELSMHYFQREAAPGEVETLLLKPNDEGLGLTSLLYANVESFLNSDLMQQAVLDAWASRP